MCLPIGSNAKVFLYFHLFRRALLKNKTPSSKLIMLTVLQIAAIAAMLLPIIAGGQNATHQLTDAVGMPTVAAAAGARDFISLGEFDGEQETDNEHRKMRHGYGVYKEVDGTTYTGEWEDNLRHGMGIYRGQSGDEYDGKWQNGERNGFGIQTYKWGIRTHEGEWRNDVAHGRGYETWFWSFIVCDGHWWEGKKTQKLTCSIPMLNWLSSCFSLLTLGICLVSVFLILPDYSVNIALKLKAKISKLRKQLKALQVAKSFVLWLWIVIIVRYVSVSLYLAAM